MIEIADLTKTYGSGSRTIVAVDSLSFHVKPGLATGFLGPNGAGKSTTMRMVLGLDRPDAGTALLGLGCGLLVRYTAGAVTTLLVVLLGLPIVGQFLPDSWQRVTRYLPPEPGWAMFTPADSSLALGPATAVFAAWVAAALGAAAITFHHRDA
ncbi:MAG: ATP-binding cassette domain-containing protein [Actinophytocola sp.]|nr:ATP-binding cassette domain-containing protein [Actinophytocola sp.]